MEGSTTALPVRSEVLVTMTLVANGQCQMAPKQKEMIEAAYEPYPESVECPAMLNRLESRLERTYARVLNTLLRLRHLRESNLAANKYSAKRTESQERTPREAESTDPT